MAKVVFIILLMTWSIFNCLNVEKRNVDKNLYIDILIYYIGYESLDAVRPLHASNGIHSQTCTCHDNNIQAFAISY